MRLISGDENDTFIAVLMVELRNIDHMAARETGHEPITKKGPSAQPDDIIVIDESETQ